MKKIQQWLNQAMSEHLTPYHDITILYVFIHHSPLKQYFKFYHAVLQMVLANQK